MIRNDRRKENFKLLTAVVGAVFVLAAMACFAMKDSYKHTAWATAHGKKDGMDATIYSGISQVVREVQVPVSAADAGFAGPGWDDSDASVVMVSKKSTDWDDPDCPDSEYCGACSSSADRTWYATVLGLTSMAASVIAHYRRSQGDESFNVRFAGVVTGLTSAGAILCALVNFSLLCFGKNINSMNELALHFQSSLGPGWHLMLFVAVINGCASAVHLLTPLLDAIDRQDLTEQLNRQVEDAMAFAHRPAYCGLETNHHPATVPKFVNSNPGRLGVASSARSGRTRNGMSMEYIPDGLTAAQWKKEKAREAKAVVDRKKRFKFKGFEDLTEWTAARDKKFPNDPGAGHRFVKLKYEDGYKKGPAGSKTTKKNTRK